MEITSKSYLSLYFKPDIRNKVLDYVKHKYGKHAVCCISTRGTQQCKAAIRNCARLLGDEKHGDTKTYLSLGDSICKAVPNELNIKLADCWNDLMDKFGDNKNAVEILNNAKLVEGTFINIGMHAAGVIISDNGDVGEYVPLMYNTDKEQWMTQCDKDESEAIGLLKMDFLGLRNLGIITETLRLIQNRYGVNIDIEKIPIEEDVLKNIFATGNTNSVFQFESNGMKQMLRQFKPSTIEDIILLVAAYRPGPMQFLDSIIQVKHGKKKPSYVIPEMEEILGTTYGYPVYQEQIMQIFNKFAGFSLGESDIIRRYMSKKKVEKFAAYKSKFVDGMITRGGSPKQVEDFWNQLLDFAKYAFNKSHAAAYTFVAYYTAWLKYHYPKEYLCSVMNDTVFDKLSGLINDCKGFGIDIKPANINISEDAFSIQGDSIVYGLGLVKNVGDSATAIIKERNENGKFTSFADFIIRTKCKKDVAESLIKAGAFDEFSSSRQALIDVVPEYVALLKKITEKKDIINDESATEKRKQNAKEALNRLYENINNIAIDSDGEENGFLRLQAEKEMSGAYISGHPLDAYKKPEDCITIEEMVPGKRVSVMGLITNLRLTKRKSDGADMAFFTLEDLTGTVNVNCFTKAFEKANKYIAEDAVVKINGQCIKDYDSFTDEEKIKINLDTIESVKEDKPEITLYVPSLMEWTDTIYKKVVPYQIKNGYPLIIYDCLSGQFRKTTLSVSKDLLKNSLGLKTSM